MDFVDLQFPPVMDAEEETDNVEPHSNEEFTTFTYWRQPFSVDEPFDLPDSDSASQ